MTGRAGRLAAQGYPGNQGVTLGDAKHGAVVVLVDGTEGVLQWLSRDHRRATVRVGTRHVRIDASRIVRVVRRGDQRS